MEEEGEKRDRIGGKNGKVKGLGRESKTTRRIDRGIEIYIYFPSTPTNAVGGYWREGERQMGS